MKRLLLTAVLLMCAGATAQIPVGTVSGEIRTRDGRPAAGTRVSAMAVPEAGAPANSGTALVSIGTTDSEGRYKLENVQPGRYYITAGFVDLPTYYPGVPAVSDATVVNVLSGTPITGINFAVTNVGVRVSGHVRRAAGTGSVGGQPVAILGGNFGLNQATTDADGSFQFQRILPGTYQFSVAGRLQPLSVVVGDQDVTGLEIAVIPTVTVTGNVVVEGNGLRPRVQLQLSPFKGTSQNASMATRPDGTFQATLPEGEYRISWSALAAGYEFKSVTSGSLDLLANSLKISAGAPPPPIRVLLSVEGNPWVKVSGRVANLGSNRTLTLTGGNVDPIQLTPNPDGTFEIAQILPGAYQVRLNSPAVPTLTTQPVSLLVPSQDTTNLILALPLMKEIQGVVANNSGAGVQGRITLTYSETRANGSSSGSMSILASQPDGRFTIHMPEGDRRISVTVPNSSHSVKSLTYGTTDLLRENMKVTSTDTAELRLVLDTTSTTLGTGTVSGGVLGGVIAGGGTSSLLVAMPPTPPPSQAASPSPSAINRVSEAVAKPNLVSSAPPAYPALARAARVQGAVVLQVEVSLEGKVLNISVMSGHPLLNEAAIQAVRQWSYKPFVLNGQPIPVTTTATVDFALP